MPMRQEAFGPELSDTDDEVEFRGWTVASRQRDGYNLHLRDFGGDRFRQKSKSLIGGMPGLLHAAR